MGRDPEVVSRTMQRVRATDTGPEVSLRKALWKRGLRYRLYDRKLPGKPDIVFRSAKVAVFVDGDFWHGNQWRIRGLGSLEDQFEGSPRAEYWIPKIRRTMVRDADRTRELEYDGWRVIRFWESVLKDDLERCAEQVAQVVRKRAAH